MWEANMTMGVCRVERELTRWQPDTSMDAPDMTMNSGAFGRPNAGSVTGWDQFETNRQKFQVHAYCKRAIP